MGRIRGQIIEHKGDNMELKIFEDIPPWEWPEDAAKIFLGVLRDDQADESDFVILEFAGLYSAGLKLGADRNAELDNGNILFYWICPAQRLKATEIIIC